MAVSGDKLMGGPQAGLLVGRADLVDRCARHPLMRAVRCGGGTLRMLERTLTAYANRDLDGLPFWSLATTTCDALRQRGASILTQLPNDRSVEMIDTVATTGGGTLPGADIASVGLALPGDRVAALRASEPPVIARAAEGTTVIDLRTVFSDQDAPVTAALARLLDRTRA